jgi:anion-transporting  ArsA/GET3 family ATPase
VSEFLTLDRLESWSRDGAYDRLIVDGPATGHALQLLRAPFQLAGIASSGPLHRPLRRLIETLRRPARATVGFVSLCEEMSVAESIEARAVVAGQLGIAVQRPVLNRCAQRRFTRDDVREIEALPAAHPLIAAARLHVAAQRRTAGFAAALKKAFTAATLGLPELDGDAAVGSGALGDALLRGWKL